MKDNRFFNPSPLYKEFMLLDVIEKNESITQRDMSSLIHASISMINDYLVRYEKEGFIKRVYRSSKNVKYTITNAGIERKKVLNVWFLSDSQKIYYKALENIQVFVNHLMDSRIQDVYLYGAGEMGELFLDVLLELNEGAFHIRGVIDDDLNKHSHDFKGFPVISLTKISPPYDAIIITSYNHHEAMQKKLLSHGVKPRLIKGFF